MQESDIKNRGMCLGLRGRKWKDTSENCIMRSCVGCTVRPVFVGWNKQGGWNGQGMWHVWRNGEVLHTGVWSGNL